MTDTPRFLARTVGYVGSPHASLHGAGEALSEDDQRLLTQQAHQSAADDRLAGLRLQLERAEKARLYHEGLMRHAEREKARIGRRLSRADAR